MKTIFIILVTFFAGMGAGLGTGFAGMSAAAVISPMLITFLHIEPYMAVGIALSSDVLASAVSAYTYHKNKNLDIKNGLIMMGSVLAFTVAGSYVASLVPAATMGGFSVFMTFLLGIKFIVRPVMTTKESMETRSTVIVLRYGNWVYLRLYRCRRRHDDASDLDKCTGLRVENCGWNQCVYNDFYSADRGIITLCDRRYAECVGVDVVRIFYSYMGAYCSCVCQQGAA